MKTNNKELKKIIDICERNGWNVDRTCDGLELSQYSPAGEDFVFYVELKDIKNDIRQYAEDFDPDEHAELWHGQHKGEPEGLRDLLKDADSIKAMLQELADEIEGKEKKKQPCEYIEQYTAKNQYNYTTLQLSINHTAQTFKVLHGGECRISKANSTKKTINEKIKALQNAGYICEGGL